MKARGRIMLVIMLVIAAALSFVSYQGIGEGKTLSAGNIKQGLDLSGGVYIVYEADKEDVTAEEMQAAVSLIQGRMDWNGWTEAEVAQEGTNRIRVDIPGVENAEEAIREIGQTAQLSFVDETGKVLLTGDMVADATKQVGAIKQAWKPLSKAISMLISATSVFPLPTSPCKRRFICFPEPKSRRIYFNTRFCAPVSSKGRLRL